MKYCGGETDRRAKNGSKWVARALAGAFMDNHKFRGGKGGHGAPDGGLCWTREARRMGCAGLRSGGW